MNQTTLLIHGTPQTAAIEPRTHLADFLREKLHLTGTHLGCEHGVCGACTLLINGAPARSCITFPTTCEGAEIQTIEGLQEDFIVTALRQAFSTRHALQCGYCTPGMLITARDIILRLPNADDDRIRLELAGNLCRCTGYNGIVRAIRDVLNQHLTITESHKQNPPTLQITPSPSPRPKKITTGEKISQTLPIPIPIAALWPALQNPSLVASCIPGATVTSVNADIITGELQLALGPIKGIFTGAAQLSYAKNAGTITGEGQDQLSKTKLSAQAEFSLTEDGAENSILTLAIIYNLRGPLAQFARGPIVQEFATEITTIVARNLTAALTGTPKTPTTGLSPLKLAFKIIMRRLRTWLS